MSCLQPQIFKSLDKSTDSKPKQPQRWRVVLKFDSVEAVVESSTKVQFGRSRCRFRDVVRVTRVSTNSRYLEICQNVGGHREQAQYGDMPLGDVAGRGVSLFAEVARNPNCWDFFAGGPLSTLKAAKVLSSVKGKFLTPPSSPQEFDSASHQLASFPRSQRSSCQDLLWRRDSRPGCAQKHPNPNPRQRANMGRSSTPKPTTLTPCWQRHLKPSGYLVVKKMSMSWFKDSIKMAIYPSINIPTEEMLDSRYSHDRFSTPLC